MSLEPDKRRGWFSAQNANLRRRISYVWERKGFPWLMTWEENGCRTEKPWDGRTLTRGLEFSSYAFPLSRRQNVEMGPLLGTPTFEWLDAHEEKIVASPTIKRALSYTRAVCKPGSGR